MNLVALLRKLGILRFGVKKYRYTSGKDMPTEALMDDVYDAKKDTVTSGDIKAAFGGKGISTKYCLLCHAHIQPDDAFCSQCGARIEHNR